MKLNKPVSQSTFYKWIIILLAISLIASLLFYILKSGIFNNLNSNSNELDFNEYVKIQKIKDESEILIDTSSYKPNLALDEKISEMQLILNDITNQSFLDTNLSNIFLLNLKNYYNVKLEIGNEYYGIYKEIRDLCHSQFDYKILVNPNLKNNCKYVEYYLQMRRDEKDFKDRSRNEEKLAEYKGKLNKSYELFKNHTLDSINSPVSSAERPRITTALENYKKQIEKFSTLIQDRNKLKQDLSKSFESLSKDFALSQNKKIKEGHNFNWLIFVIIAFTILALFIVWKQDLEHKFKKKLDDSGNTMSDYIKESKNMGEVSARVWDDYKGNLSNSKYINFVFYEINYTKNELYIVYESKENSNVNHDKVRQLDDEKHLSTKCLYLTPPSFQHERIVEI